MSGDKGKSSQAAERRRQAEERLRVQAAAVPLPRNAEETLRLVHELEVHQIELEMQNAELCQARDEAEQLLEKYTDLYDFAPVGYCTLERDGTIREANFSAATLLGRERSRLLGQRVGLYVAINDRDLFVAYLDQVFATPGKESCELSLAAADGQLRYVRIEAAAAASGQECRAAIFDLTERHKLETQNEFLASFPQLNPHPVLEVDTTGRITYCNPAASKILTALGLNDADAAVFLPADMRSILENWDSVMEVSLYREILIKDKSFGEVVFLTPQFKVARLYVTDITERKRAEALARQTLAELQAVNIELEAFNYTASHDLRSPLTTIHGYCQVLRDCCAEQLDEQARGYIQHIYKGTLRMSRLITALLNFSRMARVEMRRQRVDLSGMAREVVTELQLTEPERHVTYRIAEGITVSGDAVLLRVVLDNLVGNAWKYSATRDDAVIEFGVTERDGSDVCFVRDNGSGFDMAHAERLFVPFQRLPETCAPGDGIGLATVDRIVRRHGGRIWGESAPGQGATFFFTLQPETPAGTTLP